MRSNSNSSLLGQFAVRIRARTAGCVEYSSTSVKLRLTVSSPYMVSLGERGSLTWESIFYCVEEILVKWLFHEQRWFKVLIFTLPAILKFLSPVKELTVSNNCVVPTMNTLWLFRFHFPPSGLLCAGRLVIAWPPLDKGQQVASHWLGQPACRGALVTGLNISLTHPVWIFPLWFDSFSLMKKHNHSIMTSALFLASLCFWKGAFPNLLPISVPFCLNGLVSKALLCCWRIFVRVLKIESGKEGHSVSSPVVEFRARRPSAQTAIPAFCSCHLKQIWPHQRGRISLYRGCTVQSRSET